MQLSQYIKLNKLVQIFHNHENSFILTTPIINFLSLNIYRNMVIKY